MTTSHGPENPYSVRVIATKISGWIDRLGAIWLDGEVAQLNVRAGASTVFLTLRDTETAYSLPVVCSTRVLDAMPDGIREGTRVVVHCKPEFYAQRGSFAMRAREIRHVGLGELLARIERLRAALEAEGLFAPELKRRLPFLPRQIGLVTARDSAAEKDVLTNAELRWPGVRFRVLHVTVQGRSAAAEVASAVRRLDADPDVDVIVVARGGGSVEDLLPFSDETLCRVVASATTPVVSAIGHEPDTPLLDYVADLRASTPTDAAKRVVPDVGEERRRIAQGRARILAAVQRRIDHGYQQLESIASRPSLADPHGMITSRRDDVVREVARMRRSTTHQLHAHRAGLDAMRARVQALSPLGVLQRGYAVVQHRDGRIAAAAAVSAGESLAVTTADGRFDVTVAREPQEAP